jgi:2-isopropylmalate synthase
MTLMHDWGIPAFPVLQDATVLEGKLGREEALDYLDRLPQLGIRTVELPLEPALVEAARELDLNVLCPVETESDLEAAARLGAGFRVDPELVAATGAFQVPTQVRLRSVGQLAPSRLATWLESWKSLDRLELCLEDDQAHLQPEGLVQLLGFLTRLQTQLGTAWPVAWSQHDLEGMALYGALSAIEAGVGRVRCAGLGLAGLIPLDGLLVNLNLEGRWDGPTETLAEYCRELLDVARVDVAANYPVAGRDAFRTATGVHAMAMWRADQMGRQDLVDRIYSGVPARRFGFEQIVEVGPMSGRSNVWWWLAQHSLETDDPARVELILQAAKQHFRSLTECEIRELLGGTSRPSEPPPA